MARRPDRDPRRSIHMNVRETLLRTQRLEEFGRFALAERRVMHAELAGALGNRAQRRAAAKARRKHRR